MELELGLALPYHNPSPTTVCGEEMERWKEAPYPYHRGENKSKSTKHVKVKMEGVAIGRKVDLRNCDSYHALTHTLIHMFAKFSNIDRNWEEYSLLYQDKEGDWMLLGEDHVHVQWEVFVDSVRRIHIVLNNHNNNMGFHLLSHE